MNTTVCSLPAGCRAGVRLLLFGAGLLWLSACGDFTLFGEGGGETPAEPPTAAAAVSPTSVAACKTKSVSMDGTGSQGEGLSYSWAFSAYPEGSEAATWVSSAAKASFQPDRAGSYTVKLTVTNTGGSATEEKTFTASSAPIAVAVADPEQVVVGTSGTLDGSGSKNPGAAAAEDVCTSADLDFFWDLRDPGGTSVPDLLGNTSHNVQATVSPGAGATLGTYTATLTVKPAGQQSPTATANVSLTVSPALDQLERGSYAFKVKEPVVDTVFGVFGLFLPVNTALPDSLYIPGTDEVPHQEQLAISYTVLFYTITGGLNLEISRGTPEDQFYTISVPAGETAGSVEIKSTSSTCTVAFNRMTGTVTPETTRTVILAVSLEEVTSTGNGCAALELDQPSATGKIELTLGGACQDCGA